MEIVNNIISKVIAILMAMFWFIIYPVYHMGQVQRYNLQMYDTWNDYWKEVKTIWD